MTQRIKKRFDLNVTAENANVSDTFELDKNITAIFGLLLGSDRDDLLYYRGSQRIEINRHEIFPEKYESKLLMCGISVAPNERFYSIGKVDPGNHKVKVEYKDSASTFIAFTAYRVSIYLDCEINDEL